MTHKDVKGKIPLNLVPPRAYEAIAKVREFGNKKYGDPWGWKEACTEEQFTEAAKRHLNALSKGIELDNESGLPHLYHALTSLAMAAELYEEECEAEERFVHKHEGTCTFEESTNHDVVDWGGDIGKEVIEPFDWSSLNDKDSLEERLELIRAAGIHKLSGAQEELRKMRLKDYIKELQDSL